MNGWLNHWSAVAPAALSQAELDLLAAFNRHKVRFIIIGLSAAALQGAPVVIESIDLWFEDLGSPNFIAAVKEVGGFYIPPAVAGLNPPMLGPKQFRLFDLVTTAQGLNDFAQEYSGAIDLISSGVGYKVLPISRIIASKTAANREKDRATLPLLRSFAK